MPICWQQNPCAESICAAWHITEHMDYFLEHLNLDENPGFDVVHHPDKQLQWLASRMLVKVLLEEQLRKPFYGVYNDVHGKPWLHRHSCHVSISNSGSYASALLHERKPVGIDIELVKPKIKKIAAKYLIPLELKHWGRDVECLTMAWCCKETVYKIYGLGNISLKNHIRLQPPEGTLIKATLQVGENRDFYLKYVRLEDYMLVYNQYL